MPNDLILCGLSHRCVSGALREQLFLESAQRQRGLAELSAFGLQQALLLSTCDRLEVLAVSESEESVEDGLLSMIAEWVGVPGDLVRNSAYSLRGSDALHHFFAVTAALESQVIGEPHVLGQVKESHRQSEAMGLSGPNLERVLQAAYRLAKRVRNETSLAQRPATLAASALRVARDLYGRLDSRRLLLIGSGEMGEVLAAEFRSAGLEHIQVVQRRPALARAASERLGGHYLDWTEWEAHLERVDILLLAHGSGQFLLERGQAEHLLKQRRRRPLLFLDTGVPRDIEPDVNDVEGAFVYDLLDLEHRARAGQQAREEAAGRAWEILAEELDSFSREGQLGSTDSPLVALRRHCEDLRAEVLADGKLDAEAATRLLLNRLLHAPTRTLREMSAESSAAQAEAERFLKQLFRIETGKGKNDR